MSRTHYSICTLCEATCGLAIELEGQRILSIKGDDQDPFSRGHICPKAVALQDLHDDPDRLRKPLRKVRGEWVEVSWNDAIAEAGDRLGALRKLHGSQSIAFYYGNPTAHSYQALLYMLPFVELLQTRNIYSSASVDALPRQLTSLKLYGNQALIPVPDIDRTDFMLILGANPVVSNGSVMTAPGVKKRLKAIRQRGGHLVVVDPRRTETAKLADRHLAINPGSDAYLLLAMLHTLFEGGRIDSKRLPSYIEGVEQLRGYTQPFSPEKVAERVGIEAQTIRELADEFDKAPSAVCYGRMGTSVQQFGATTGWLIDALNAVTGNLDRVGGAMFTTPAADLAAIAKLMNQLGSFKTWTTRVGGYPECNGESPVAAFAEEMETRGRGQIRALVTHAGNPVLSLPNGRRLDAAFAELEFMVCIDIYLNETTRHADLILPPTSPLERDHYPLLFHALSVRNTAHYTEALYPKPEGSKEDWEIFVELGRRFSKHIGTLSALSARFQHRLGGALGPRRMLDLFLRAGPHPLTVKKLLAAPHGIDLGALEPRLPRILATPGRKLRLVPELFQADRLRLEQELGAEPHDLVLIGRRDLRSNNSWMHNSQRLVKGPKRCSLLMNPADAESRGLDDGARVALTTRIGTIDVELQISDEMKPGVVCLPHGWGHNREGIRLSVASEHAGQSFNDITDEAAIDTLSGTAILTGFAVTVKEAT